MDNDILNVEPISRNEVTITVQSITPAQTLHFNGKPKLYEFSKIINNYLTLDRMQMMNSKVRIIPHYLYKSIIHQDSEEPYTKYVQIPDKLCCNHPIVFFF